MTMKPEHATDDEALDDDVRLDDDTDLDPGPGEAEAEARAAQEEEASALGWKPETEWKGDKSGWVPAEKFLERLNPARMRDTIDKQSRELQQLKAEREREQRETQARIERLDKMNRTALARQREQILGDLHQKKRAATEAGDLDAFDELQDVENQVRKQIAEEDEQFAEAPPTQKQQTQQTDPTVDAWVKSNPAIAYNPAKWQAAIAFFTEAENENPNGSVEDHLRHVEDRINEAWPNTIKGRSARNGNGNGQRPDEIRERSRGPQLEAGGRSPSRQTRGKGWNDIPAEERVIYKNYIKEGLFKDEADAAKAHWS